MQHLHRTQFVKSLFNLNRNSLVPLAHRGVCVCLFICLRVFCFDKFELHSLDVFGCVYYYFSTIGFSFVVFFVWFCFVLFKQ